MSARSGFTPDSRQLVSEAGTKRCGYGTRCRKELRAGKGIEGPSDASRVAGGRRACIGRVPDATVLLWDLPK